jgi:hypothetical protein
MFEVSEGFGEFLVFFFQLKNGFFTLFFQLKHGFFEV